jgi:hypothetical protein
MIGETPEWMLWAIVRLLAFMMLLPAEALTVLPPTGAGDHHIRYLGSRI